MWCMPSSFIWLLLMGAGPSGPKWLQTQSYQLVARAAILSAATSDLERRGHGAVGEYDVGVVLQRAQVARPEGCVSVGRVQQRARPRDGRPGAGRVLVGVRLIERHVTQDSSFSQLKRRSSAAA